MNLWPFRSAPLSPQWGYDTHEYIGVENGCHVYRVTFARGTERQAHVYRFHARSVDRAKDEAKLMRYFAAEAAVINRTSP